MTTQSTERQAVVDAFQHLYYDQPENTWDNTYWLGVPTQKCPLDLWVYQEIIFELRPDVIVECGTCKGGSALFLASMCDMVRNGRVFSIDTSRNDLALTTRECATSSDHRRTPMLPVWYASRHGRRIGCWFSSIRITPKSTC